MPEQRFYTGYSGQMAVVAELVFRRCNAAMPAIDEGTDVFAFTEDRPEVARIQVKTSQGTPYAQTGCSAQFKIPLSTLQAVDDPPLFYALAVRLHGKWVEFVVISRKDLRQYWETNANFGTVADDGKILSLRVQFRAQTVVCSGVSLLPHRNAWNDLPPLRSPVPLPNLLAVPPVANPPAP